MRYKTVFFMCFPNISNLVGIVYHANLIRALVLGVVKLPICYFIASIPKNHAPSKSVYLKKFCFSSYSNILKLRCYCSNFVYLLIILYCLSSPFFPSPWLIPSHSLSFSLSLSLSLIPSHFLSLLFHFSSLAIGMGHFAWRLKWVVCSLA